MGSFITKFFSKLFKEIKESNIIMIGLDAAGKTTILYNLKLSEVITTTPTIGFNIETLQYKNVKFTVWDLGGQDKLRLCWDKYFKMNSYDAVIYVVDCSDFERINDSKDELHRILGYKDMKTTPILIYANKQDIKVFNVEQLIEKFEMEKIVERKWLVQGTCALTGEGLYQGLDWISQILKNKK